MAADCRVDRLANSFSSLCLDSHSSESLCSASDAACLSTYATAPPKATAHSRKNLVLSSKDQAHSRAITLFQTRVTEEMQWSSQRQNTPSVPRHLQLSSPTDRYIQEQNVKVPLLLEQAADVTNRIIIHLVYPIQTFHLTDLSHLLTDLARFGRDGSRFSIDIVSAVLESAPETFLKELSNKLAPYILSITYRSMGDHTKTHQKRLLELLSKTIQLETLNLPNCTGSNGITLAPGHIIELILALSKLQELRIDSNNDLTDDHVRQIAEQCPYLKRVSLVNNSGLTSKGFIHLFFYCYHIQKLNASECNISEDFFAYLNNIKNTTLSHLTLESCALSDTSLTLMCQGDYLLQELVLTDASGITAEALNTIRREHPSIRITPDLQLPSPPLQSNAHIEEIRAEKKITFDYFAAYFKELFTHSVVSLENDGIALRITHAVSANKTDKLFPSYILHFLKKHQIFLTISVPVQNLVLKLLQEISPYCTTLVFENGARPATSTFPLLKALTLTLMSDPVNALTDLYCPSLEHLGIRKCQNVDSQKLYSLIKMHPQKFPKLSTLNLKGSALSFKELLNLFGSIQTIYFTPPKEQIDERFDTPERLELIVALHCLDRTKYAPQIRQLTDTLLVNSDNCPQILKKGFIHGIKPLCDHAKYWLHVNLKLNVAWQQKRFVIELHSITTFEGHPKKEEYIKLLHSFAANGPLELSLKNDSTTDTTINLLFSLLGHSITSLWYWHTSRLPLSETAMSSLTALKELYLQECQITTQSIQPSRPAQPPRIIITAWTQQLLQNVKSIQKLGFIRCKGLHTEVFKQNSTLFNSLTSLTLRNNDDFCEASLINSLDDCARLHELNLSDSPLVTDAVIKSVSEAIPNLKILNLSNCQSITDNALAPSTCILSKLQQLLLSETNLTVKAFELLGKTRRELQVLLMPPGHVTLSNLTCFIPQLPFLEVLEIPNSQGIDDHAVKFISQHLGNLRELRIQNSPFVSGESLHTLTTSCPHLTTLQLGCSIDLETLHALETDLSFKHSLTIDFTTNATQKEREICVLRAHQVKTVTFLNCSATDLASFSAICRLFYERRFRKDGSCVVRSVTFSGFNTEPSSYLAVASDLFFDCKEVSLYSPISKATIKALKPFTQIKKLTLKQEITPYTPLMIDDNALLNRTSSSSLSQPKAVAAVIDEATLKHLVTKHTTAKSLYLPPKMEPV